MICILIGCPIRCSATWLQLSAFRINLCRVIAGSLYFLPSMSLSASVTMQDLLKRHCRAQGVINVIDFRRCHHGCLACSPLWLHTAGCLSLPFLGDSAKWKEYSALRRDYFDCTACKLFVSSVLIRLFYRSSPSIYKFIPSSVSVFQQAAQLGQSSGP